MNATVVLDEELLAEAASITGEQDRSLLLDQALRFFVDAKRVDAAARDRRMLLEELTEIGGSDPDAWAPARRRFE